jgi:hypothetical protein
VPTELQLILILNTTFANSIPKAVSTVLICAAVNGVLLMVNHFGISLYRSHYSSCMGGLNFSLAADLLLQELDRKAVVVIVGFGQLTDF